ncbi:hypothetical protein IT409_02590 [Candidatus Falkowbacteria bacterium]|nr:hypothetical protein [Candidatus Falkowbacteria bacterium]
MNKEKLHDVLFKIDALTLESQIITLLTQAQQEQISFSEVLEFVAKNITLTPKKFLEVALQLSDVIAQPQTSNSEQEIKKSRNQENNESKNQLETSNQKLATSNLQPNFIQPATTFDDVINQLPFESRKSARAIGLSFVKSVRNELDTFDALTREMSAGGAQLSYAQAQDLVATLHEFKQDHDQRGSNASDKVLGSVQDLPLDNDAHKHEPHHFIEHTSNHPDIKDVVEHIKYHKKIIEKVPELSTPNPPLIMTNQPGRPIPPEINELIEKEKLTAPPINPSTPLTRANLRPLMQEVVANEVVTPVSELGRLTVTDFRRMDKDPEIAIQKIAEKLDLLAQDSLLQREAGIASLFASPLYKAYADILNNSLLQGKSFEEVIAKKAHLALPEFNALMTLNAKLRYKV